MPYCFVRSGQTTRRVFSCKIITVDSVNHILAAIHAYTGCMAINPASKRYSLWVARKDDFSDIRRFASGMAFGAAGWLGRREVGLPPPRKVHIGDVVAPYSVCYVGWVKTAPDLWVLQGPQGRAVISLDR